MIKENVLWCPGQEIQVLDLVIIDCLNVSSEGNRALSVGPVLLSPRSHLGPEAQGLDTLGLKGKCEVLSEACPPETEPQFPLKLPLLGRALNPFGSSGTLANGPNLCHASRGAASLRLDLMACVSLP